MTATQSPVLFRESPGEAAIALKAHTADRMTQAIDIAQEVADLHIKAGDIGVPVRPFGAMGGVLPGEMWMSILRRAVEEFIAEAIEHYAAQGVWPADIYDSLPRGLTSQFEIRERLRLPTWDKADWRHGQQLVNRYPFRELVEEITGLTDNPEVSQLQDKLLKRKPGL